MKQTFTINQFDNHLLIENQNKTFLIDTGSPFSSFDGEDFDFLGIRARKGLFSISSAAISELLGMHINNLIGNDVLKHFNVLIDYAQGTITFSDEPVDLPDGQAFPIDNSFGVPKITMQLRGCEGRFFLDTGAKISYVKSSCLDGMVPDGHTTDFYVGYGNFDTPIYQVPTNIGGHNFSVQFGKLPDLLERSLIGLSGTEGVIGYDFFHSFKVLLDYKNDTLWLEPAKKDSSSEFLV